MSELEPVSYADGAVSLTGLVARPAGAARAAVLVLPTIANASAATERRARMLADAGYIAFIADFYGFTPVGPEAVQSAARDLRRDVEAYRGRLHAAFSALASLSGSGGLPRAAIGYCMGGQAALELARDGADLGVVVSFHGILDSAKPATKPGQIKARLLVCHGDADPLVPREQVAAFRQEMDAAAANLHVHSYSGVKHGFTDPGSDTRGLDAVAYDASADRQSWAAMLGIFDETFPPSG
jgi:dienelactone hydrolase